MKRLHFSPDPFPFWLSLLRPLPVWYSESKTPTPLHGPKESRVLLNLAPRVARPLVTLPAAKADLHQHECPHENPHLWSTHMVPVSEGGQRCQSPPSQPKGQPRLAVCLQPTLSTLESPLGLEPMGWLCPHVFRKSDGKIQSTSQQAERQPWRPASPRILGSHVP